MAHMTGLSITHDRFNMPLGAIRVDVSKDVVKYRRSVIDAEVRVAYADKFVIAGMMILVEGRLSTGVQL
jgi:hypothetical protein